MGKLQGVLGWALGVGMVCGCGGGVELVLKSPVQEKCEGTGLQGCPELTDGVILFVEGDKGGGAKKLIAGAAQNAPDKIKKFAGAIRDLERIPGAGEYAKPLIEIAKLLTKGAEDRAKSEGTSARKVVAPAGWVLGTEPKAEGAAQGAVAGSTRSDAPQNAITADTDVYRIRTGTTTPSSAAGSFPCGTLLASGVGQCIKILDGPFVVSDLSTSSGCSDAMLAVAAGGERSSGAPRWSIDSPANVHGARLRVNDGDALFIGTRAASDSKLNVVRECRLTWSGFRPYSAVKAYEDTAVREPDPTTPASTTTPATKERQ
jgi:hypothetical protein